MNLNVFEALNTCTKLEMNDAKIKVNRPTAREELVHSRVERPKCWARRPCVAQVVCSLPLLRSASQQLKTRGSSPCLHDGRGEAAMEDMTLTRAAPQGFPL
ncbi:hypothetical protein HAX54_038745 [Datura stramonium]|uniref:Uncharacterized protein n=1 Tax=Datura stramonium TaxID=4076 RepID=A0ABS8SI83_DATST|nr:hypothetical protein [Datura stramonium]